MTTGDRYSSTWNDERYWPNAVAAQPAPADQALALLTHSVRQGATVVAIGALTNLAALELRRPGALAGVPIVAMAGAIRAPLPHLPPWGAEMDFNVQADTDAARIVFDSDADLTLVPIEVAMRAWLREPDLDRLRASGPIGTLLARQSQVHAVDVHIAGHAERHRGLPADLVNFHWDPLTCAVALGWDVVTHEQVRVRTETDAAGILRLRPDPQGRPVGVVTDVDGPAFAARWLASIEAAEARHWRPAW